MGRENKPVMENPDAERIIQQTLAKYTVSYELSGGSSLAKRIADALREAGLLVSGVPLTAAALAEVDRVQREMRGNWSRGGDEAELEALRGLAEALRLDLGMQAGGNSRLDSGAG